MHNTANKVGGLAYQRHLWSNVEHWVGILRIVDYHLTDRRKILRDLINSSQINILVIIFDTNKITFQSKLEEKIPTLKRVQSSVKQIYNHDEYKYFIKKQNKYF